MFAFQTMELHLSYPYEIITYSERLVMSEVHKAAKRNSFSDYCITGG